MVGCKRGYGGYHLSSNPCVSCLWKTQSLSNEFVFEFSLCRTTVTEPCHAYKNNALKCAPDDAIIRSGTGSISIPTALPLQGGFALPGSCKNFPDWQHAIQCQGATTTTMTLTPVSNLPSLTLGNKYWQLFHSRQQRGQCGLPILL